MVSVSSSTRHGYDSSKHQPLYSSPSILYCSLLSSIDIKLPIEFIHYVIYDIVCTCIAKHLGWSIFSFGVVLSQQFWRVCMLAIERTYKRVDILKCLRNQHSKCIWACLNIRVAHFTRARKYPYCIRVTCVRGMMWNMTYCLLQSLEVMLLLHLPACTIWLFISLCCTSYQLLCCYYLSHY